MNNALINNKKLKIIKYVKNTQHNHSEKNVIQK